MKLSEQIKKLPAGKVISVAPKAMSLVRYHARGCRDIVSRVNLATGQRDVRLGEFYHRPTLKALDELMAHRKRKVARP